MLLRRVIQHVTEQNWTAILLDLGIVVLGVFIGIQVSNWNAARADKVRAGAYIERLSNDLDADLETFEDRIEFWNLVSSHGAAGLAYAETGETGGREPWELLLAYFQASQVAEFFTTNNTYEELKSAGELGLIADTQLREALAHYYSLGINPALTERPRYRERVRGIIPLAIQIHIWTACYQSDAQGKQQMLDCESPVSEAAAAAIVDEIAGNRELMAELRYWISTMQVATIIGRDRAGAARAARALTAIGENRGQSQVPESE